MYGEVSFVLNFTYFTPVATVAVAVSHYRSVAGCTKQT